MGCRNDEFLPCLARAIPSCLGKNIEMSECLFSENYLFERCRYKYIQGKLGGDKNQRTLEVLQGFDKKVYSHEITILVDMWKLVIKMSHFLEFAKDISLKGFYL